ncbi:MAG: LysM peptidoglycan-binding domain-containing protein [Clostridia bacterium]|nr:LysM peptidoglycan-binding domain-containing protein [Clostridia bacterium]MBR0444215.1 LysM peptidoglycan-binding domain-containing protein [Clostridia bacterium]
MEEKEVVKLSEENLEAVAGGVRYKDGVLGPIFQYTIQRGDTLGELAKKYHTTVNTLMSLNTDTIVNKNKIYAGHKMWICDNRKYQ